MATDPNLAPHAIGLEDLKRNWGIFVTFGAVLILLGLLALGYSEFVTDFAVGVLGWMLLFGGVLSIAHAFLERRWGGYFIDLFSGILYAILGVMIINRPERAADFLTLIIAFSLMINGSFRIAIALSGPYHHRAWMIVNGLISAFLGVIIWAQWPGSADWIIGMFIGVDLVFYGWSMVMLGLSVKNLPEKPA